MDDSVRDRFWKKVQKSDACWTWTAKKNKPGYGIFSFEKKRVLAHRMAWILSVGPIKKAMSICHHCDNPSCVNPAHLFQGTQTENTADRHRKGRTARGPKMSAMMRRNWQQNRASFSSVIGSNHPRSKLDEKKAKEARTMAAEGVSQRAIARHFLVSRTAIRFLLSGRSWKGAL